ncbi:MAG TPA: hypothetical protein VFB59_01070 [Candidatus Saccharimonadales bacterium]|nr:hypothetical protein [Candidatus Saccharimonadales bacterium]
MRRLADFLTRAKYLFLFFLVIGSVVITLIPKTAHAAGEVYLWLSNTSVDVSGGDLKSSTRLTANAANATSFFGTFTHKTDCQFKVELLAFASGARLRIPTSLGGSGPNITNPCNVSITNTYDNQAVTIQGNRPGAGDAPETAPQKHVSVTLYSPSPASQSPSSVTFIFKNAAGETMGIPTSTQQTADQNPNPGDRAVYYAAGIDLEPGNYSVCPSAIVTTCQNFTKVKYQGLTLNYGESFSSRSVEVKVLLTVNKTPGEDINGGPLALSLQKTDGTGVPVTIQTNSATLPSDSSSSILTLVGTFGNIDAGTYKVCITAPDICQEVVKSAGSNATVSFSVTGDVAQNLLAGKASTSQDWCKSNGGDSAWWMCGPVNLAVNAIQLLDCQILDLVKINTVAIFHTGGAEVTTLPNCPARLFAEAPPDSKSAETSNAYRTAWGAFRNIAYIILVILGLIMIASQIMGLDIFDAYTIRKMLPKLIIAVIFLTLSWNIMQFLFTGANAAADAVMAIIEYPFRNINAANGASITNATFAWIIPALLLAGGGIGITAAVGLLGFVGVLSLVASALLAVFSVWLILVARDVVATLLIMASPLAIICAAYEPFDGLFKFWRGLLIGILISIPAVGAILAITHAAAFISLIGR